MNTRIFLEVDSINEARKRVEAIINYLDSMNMLNDFDVFVLSDGDIKVIVEPKVRNVDFEFLKYLFSLGDDDEQ